MEPTVNYIRGYMRIIAFSLVVCLFSQANAADLELKIELKDQVVINKHPRSLSKTITNTSSKDVTLVLPGDGSRYGWRTPVIGWSVIPADDKKTKHPEVPTPPKVVARCGNINALKADEVFTLKPGESKVIDRGVGIPPFPGPGKYRIKFFYSNIPDIKWSGVPLGKHDPQAASKIPGSTPCKLISNELIVTVTK